uniref:DNA adenine methylase n=1 Tax=Escherichia coli TaxID=562 RepID=UPI002279822D|nr:DNA adenine methylase [Escherichia coli]
MWHTDKAERRRLVAKTYTNHQMGGGKTKLMPFLSKHFPHDKSRRWVEPFIGGGAVFLNMFATEALPADSNPDLINLYRNIQRNKPAFIREVQLLAERHF